MSDAQGHPLSEFGEWIHIVSIAFDTMSGIGSLFVLWLYNRYLHLLHNSLNGLLVGASIGTLCLSALNLTANAASLLELKYTTISCNILIPTVVFLVTFLSGTLAAFYIQISLVKRRGESAALQRYLWMYYVIIITFGLGAAAYAAVEFHRDNGAPKINPRNNDRYCSLPEAGAVVFIIPTIAEIVMLFMGCAAIIQILCRPQSISTRAKKFLGARAAFVVVLFVLRTLTAVYHVKSGNDPEIKGWDRRISFLSICALLNMFFDSLMGLILFLMFFWMEGGWELMRRFWRRRYRRFKRRKQRAEKQKVLASIMGTKDNSGDHFESRGGNQDSRVATYGGASTREGTREVAEEVPFLSREYSANVYGAAVRGGPPSKGIFGVNKSAVPGAAGGNEETGSVDSHQRHNDDYSESTHSSEDDHHGPAGGAGSVAYSPTGSKVNEPSPNATSSAPNGGPRNKKGRRKRSDHAKDLRIKRTTLSGILGAISEEIHGSAPPRMSSGHTVSYHEQCNSDEFTNNTSPWASGTYPHAPPPSGPRTNSPGKTAMDTIHRGPGTSGAATPQHSAAGRPHNQAAGGNDRNQFAAFDSRNGLPESTEYSSMTRTTVEPEEEEEQ